MQPRTPRLAVAPLLAFALLSALSLTGCGLAESIGEKFAPDQDVTIFARIDRSGTIVRTTGGTDVEVHPGIFFAGDTITNHQAITVLGFPIDASQQPAQSSLDRVTLFVWVEPEAGDATDLGPGLLAHLPGHPDALLTPGLVPHPPGDDVNSFPNDGNTGWRSIDVTPHVLQDWNAGRTITAFTQRLTLPTNGNVQRDTILTEGADGAGNPLRAHIVLTFSLDL